MRSKLREALSDACYAMFNFLKTQYGGYEEMAKALDKAKAALAEPLRNCEVGTAEEQYARYCQSLEKDSGKSVLDLQGHYELTAKCFAHWSQMPCEEMK